MRFELAFSDHRQNHSAHVACKWRHAQLRAQEPHMAVFFNRHSPQVYFRGLPRFAKTNPRASAAHRSRLASLSASLRSRLGGIRRASSKAYAARVSQSSLSVERCVSLLIAPQSSCCLDSLEAFDSKDSNLSDVIPGLDFRVRSRLGATCRGPSQSISFSGDSIWIIAPEWTPSECHLAHLPPLRKDARTTLHGGLTAA